MLADNDTIWRISTTCRTFGIQRARPQILGAKVILDLHDPMPELMMTIFGLREQSFSVRVLKLLEKLSLGFADAVLTVNQACKNIFSARSCPSTKVTVIMNSPDAKIFRDRSAGPEVSVTREVSKPFVIMYHGSLVERHGLDLAVTALGKIKESIPQRGTADLRPEHALPGGRDGFGSGVAAA